MLCNPEINQTHFLEEGNGDVPVADFSASATMITAGESVDFTDATTVCPNLWTWSVSPATGWEFINGTNANSLNPEIQFNNSGTYLVSLIASNSNGDSQEVTETINVASAAGIDENNSFEMSLFPNPAHAALNIDISVPTAGAKIRVISALGTETITEFDFTQVVDISNLALGLYFLEVELPNGMKQTQRFVKE
jgi:PKD repeat protein